MIFPCRRSSMLRPAKLAQAENAVEIHLNHRHPRLQVVVLRRLAVNGAGIVHQNIRRPMADDTASYSRSAPSGWLRSAAKLCDLWPKARIASLVSSAGRRFPWHATDAPASASATAIAAPSPVAEPVTSASFPSRRNLSRIPIVYRSVFFGVASRLSTSAGRLSVPACGTIPARALCPD